MLLIVLLAAAEPAIDCSNAMAQMEMNICSYQDYLAADRKLNEAWASAASRAKAADRDSTGGNFARLLDAQRKWIAFRDAECLAQNGPREESGTIWPLLQNTCMQQLTEARIANLRAYVETGN